MKRMVEKNLTLPFNFYCLSDTEIEGIQTIPLDLSLDLESYWWKICLFNTDLIFPCMYFDLDIVVQNNFDSIFEKIKPNKLLVINSEDNGQTAHSEVDWPSDLPYSYINSSVIGFYPQQHKNLYNSFMENRDHNIVKYYGLDRYLSNVFRNQLTYLKYLDDWYYRHYMSQHNLDKKYFQKHGNVDLAFVPHSKFCVVKHLENFDDPYIGLEEFFL